MKDPHSGDQPGGGASGGGSADVAAHPPSAAAGAWKAGAAPAKGAAPGSVAQQKPKSRKRRKRRGRKVFSRDPQTGAVQTGAVQTGAAQAGPQSAAGRQSGLVSAGAASGTAPAGGSAARPVPAEQNQSTPSQKAGPQGNRPERSWQGGFSQNGSRQGRGHDGFRHEGVRQPSRFPPAARFPQRRAHSDDLPVFAALDLGTNNCRLLVAVPGRPGQFRVIDAFSRIVRLGEGLSASGRLGDAAMQRSIEALKICADKLASRDVRRARLIATEACRSAANGAEFLARVEAETGLVLEIIDRETEARLAVSGCGSLVERDTDGVVLFDIGGGSSEIALIDLTGHRTARLASHIVSWTSLPVGVVSLAERFGGRDVSRDTFRAMIDDVATHLARFEGRGRLNHMVSGDRFHLLGTSGTVTTLAGVHLGLERYDRRRVDGLWMDRVSVDGMVERLLGWDFQARVANPCIGADRADLVLAGCAILEAIREVWPSQRLRVADRGLREGILSELMAEEGVWRRDRHEGRRP